MSDKVNLFCKDCGSSKLSARCDADLDESKLEWVLGYVDGPAYCEACGSEVEEIELRGNSSNIGTTAAVLIDEGAPWQQSGDYDYAVTAAGGTRYYITGNAATRPRDGELVVLRKVDPWRWEVISNEQ